MMACSKPFTCKHRIRLAISQVVNSTITLDNSPSLHIAHQRGRFLYHFSDEDRAIICADTNGLGEIRLSNDGTSWKRGALDYISWTLVAGEGQKSVYLQANDIPGHAPPLPQRSSWILCCQAVVALSKTIMAT